ncbi:MAG: hypothetical protein KC996_05640 [Phycisphaerales bacterium]|nr:hypothetical protein [Phycisphaerales bacterium]
MRVAILMNPRSGRNKAERLADELARLLRARGHGVTLRDVHGPDEPMSGTLSGCERVVVVGGDGTVHHLLRPLCDAQVPVYHLATGTANLIAKYFRFSRNPATIVGDLEREHEPVCLDVPTANGTPFLIMLSLGMDASVIHRFEASRTTSGGYRAYFGPTLRELLSPRPARLSIEHGTHQGTMMGRPGGLMVANMPSYALGINPCADADPSDGLIDARMYRAGTAIGCGFRFALMRLRLGAGSTLRTPSIRIRTIDRACAVQIDGENPTGVVGLTDGFLHPGGELVVGFDGGKIPLHGVGRG